MDKNILIDVDGLINVLRAIGDGKPVEYRPLEKSGWRAFDPTKNEIDTENYKYRVKPKEYPDEPDGHRLIMKELEEGRIYRIIDGESNGIPSKDPSAFGYICVSDNMCSFGQDDLLFHFLLKKQHYGSVLSVTDPECQGVRSVKTNEMANIIAPYIKLPSLKGYAFTMATKRDVKLLDEILHQVGYKFENERMVKV